MAIFLQDFFLLHRSLIAIEGQMAIAERVGEEKRTK